MRSRVSLIPKLMTQMWEQMERPHRLFDQHFGQHFMMHPESFFTPLERKIFREMQSPLHSRALADFYRDQEQYQRGQSVIKDDKDKFSVQIDTSQFSPDEVNVRVVDDQIIVEGKHEEKQDDHGRIYRHFIRKYTVPEICETEKATSTLSEDGILSITIPRKPESIEQKREKVIKIEKTGKLAIEKKKEEPTEETQQMENTKVAHSQ
ncbi:alpha-crystallin A chain [Copidosoma floridanum]|uniref:alpha-crystallin A chain n=1 Tax=Copidosoma floridanum TaxID=29053 RepID=UPI0006C99908|nr:alpha-crystallin A chain [Copidosoma floridanum]